MHEIQNMVQKRMRYPFLASTVTLYHPNFRNIPALFDVRQLCHADPKTGMRQLLPPDPSRPLLTTLPFHVYSTPPCRRPQPARGLSIYPDSSKFSEHVSSIRCPPASPRSPQASFCQCGFIHPPPPWPELLYVLYSAIPQDCKRLFNLSRSSFDTELSRPDQSSRLGFPIVKSASSIPTPLLSDEGVQSFGSARGA